MGHTVKPAGNDAGGRRQDAGCRMLDARRLFESERMSSRFRRSICALLLAAAALALPGCAGVQPWQRGRLSEYGMRPDRDPLADALAEHTYFSREAAFGGKGIGGGGCGCN